ncbi:hypothetical protein RCL_jg12639.t1 [Rhizophagus clarus]|uniref:Uncharacterized protein n=1 Tax=Rhizophagus clarus TaxID=94130 RepID=A0A8H3LPH6_9GLOM|nr:hypothetical protein RCL_jg12639.t1 [Rhizophagus clarus]
MKISQEIENNKTKSIEFFDLPVSDIQSAAMNVNQFIRFYHMIIFFLHPHKKKGHLMRSYAFIYCTILNLEY